MPLLEDRPQFSTESFGPSWQEQMRPTFAPLHLLSLAEMLTYHLVDGGLDKAGRNRLAVT